MDAAWIFQYHARGHMWTGGESAQNLVILLDLAPAVGRSKMVYVHRQFKKTLCSLSLLAAASHPNLSSKYGYSGSQTQSQAVGKISNELSVVHCIYGVSTQSKWSQMSESQAYHF